MSVVLLDTHVVQWWSAAPPVSRRDPADRLIYAAAVEHGVLLVTRDARLRRAGRSVAV